MESTVSIAVLAGGKSTRMGRSKSFVLLDGKPIIEHVLARLASLNLPITLITNTPAEYTSYQLPTVTDILPDKGALGGLYTALQVSQTHYTLCVACDMPFLNTRLLQHLIALRDKAEIIAPKLNDYPETLHTVYHKKCLPLIRQRLDAGDLRINRFYTAAVVHYVEPDQLRQFDPDLRSFSNLNTPDELAAAQAASPQQDRLERVMHL